MTKYRPINIGIEIGPMRLPGGADFSTKAYRDFYRVDGILLWLRLLPFGVFLVFTIETKSGSHAEASPNAKAATYDIAATDRVIEPFSFEYAGAGVEDPGRAQRESCVGGVVVRR
jgi:hypothetical protein